jgi:hypothetical protein
MLKQVVDIETTGAEKRGRGTQELCSCLSKQMLTYVQVLQSPCPGDADAILQTPSTRCLSRRGCSSIPVQGIKYSRRTKCRRDISGDSRFTCVHRNLEPTTEGLCPTPHVTAIEPLLRRAAHVCLLIERK